MSCVYDSNGGGCGLDCTCTVDAQGALSWICAAPPCPVQACPPVPPQPFTACTTGTDCSYYEDAGCGGEYCSCGPSGSWYCQIEDCADAGAPVEAGQGF